MTSYTIPLFRCVCGETIPVNSQTGGNCDRCGRRYSGRAIDVSMTMTMDGSFRRAQQVENDEMIGKSLDHFTIVDRLGVGGMGTVYRALDESLQRYVALKIIRPRDGGSVNTSDADHVEGLLQEARAQARVNHSNIVHIYFVSRDKRTPFFAMELVPGDTVADRIANGGLPYKDVVSIGLQVAYALRESAKFDIVHGDIKPSNILLNGDFAKLSDFGLAQRVKPGDSGTGRTVGTPNYMAPETCRGEPPSSRADMYSFGVMLFEMTFGRLPYSFSDTSVMSRLDAHQHRAPEFPDQWPRELPQMWRGFLARLLAKNPEDRFPDWDALIVEMESLRPLPLVVAGRLQRGIAWGLDLSILIGALMIITLGSSKIVDVYFNSSGFLSSLTIASGLIVPAFVMWCLGRGYSSPGKALMQLRVVDRYGLKLNPRVLAQRSIIQYLPIWLFPAGIRTEYAGLPDYIWQPLMVLMALYLVVDVLFALVRKGGRSLHDQLFDTSVALVAAES